MFAKTKIQIDQYVQAKNWYWYVPLWLFGGWVFICLLRFDPNAGLPFPINVAQAFDFFLHEMAHLVTAFLPAVLTASAGSLSELLLGSLLIWGAFKSRSYFTVLITCLWFMLACQSAGTYMADARAQKLSLVSLGGALSGSDTALHDWHFVFGQLHILRFDTLIGNTIRGIGILVGLAGLSFSAWLLYKMAVAKDQPVMSAAEKELLRASGGELKSSTSPKVSRHGAVYPAATRGALSEASEPASRPHKDGSGGDG